MNKCSASICIFPSLLEQFSFLNVVFPTLFNERFSHCPRSSEHFLRDKPKNRSSLDIGYRKISRGLTEVVADNKLARVGLRLSHPLSLPEKASLRWHSCRGENVDSAGRSGAWTPSASDLYLSHVGWHLYVCLRGITSTKKRPRPIFKSLYFLILSIWCEELQLLAEIIII